MGRDGPESEPQHPLASNSSGPPPCRVCERTMVLVGRETAAARPGAETLTFECACGETYVVTTTTTQH